MSEKILVIDTETSGIAFDKDITRNQQIVSIGLIVADSDNLTELDSVYCEIKWNGTSQWNSKAEKIHGLTKAYLEQHGMDEEEAVFKIMSFIMKHFDIDTPIILLGHNARAFDLPFLEKLLHKFDFEVKFSHRTIDSFSIGFACFNTKDSDELFSKFYKKRTEHNSLDDARMALGICRKVRKIMEAFINE